jgi:hypothetical protein
VLAVGMVPAAAFAEAGSDEAAEDASLELLAQTPAEAAANGTIVKFEDNLADGVSSVAGTDAKVLVPTKVLAENEEDSAANYIDVSAKDSYKVAYYKVDTKDGVKLTISNKDILLNGKTVKVEQEDSKAKTYTADTIKNTPGTYVVVAYAEAGETNPTLVINAASFTIQAQSLTNAQIYEVNASKLTDVSDTTFDFNGSEYTFATSDLSDKTAANTLNLAVDGVALDPTNFDVKIYNTDNTAAAEAKFAGTYKVVVTGKDTSAYAGQSIERTLTINAVDLAKADIVLADINMGDDDTNADEDSGLYSTTIESINGVAKGEEDSETLANYLKISKYSDLVTKAGTYKATVVLDEDALPENTTAAEKALWKASVLNSQDVSFDVVEASQTPTLKYDGVTVGTSEGQKYGDSDNAYTINRAKSNSKEFDASKIVVTAKDADDNTKDITLTTDQYTLKVVKVAADDTESAATVADLANPGTYKVTAEIKASAFDYKTSGASAAMYVTVTNGTIESANISFTYKGKVVTDLSSTTDGSVTAIEYDGNNQLDNIKTVVKTKEGTTVAASDYTVVVEKQDTKDTSKYTEVTEIVDAGTYRLTVKSDKYDIPTDGNTLAVKVTPKSIKVVQVKTDVKDAGVAAVLYTGSEITPVFQYNKNEGSTELAAAYADIDASAIKVKITKFVDTANNTYQNAKAPSVVKEAGTYTFTVSDADTNDNFAVDEENTTLTLVVTAKKVFIDVPSNAWYTQYVYAANVQGYVQGYNNGNVFGPNDNIKRQDVVVILARMAGVDTYGEDYSDTEVSYTTPFEDVDANAYYAKAVAWAQKTGIVTGTSSTTFEPDRSITRQEFATMLARYAALRDGSATGAATSLAKYADGTAVANWAQTYVAWAIENEIMGVNTTVLNPTSSISRAEVTAMVVRYQPTKDTIIDITTPVSNSSSNE